MLEIIVICTSFPSEMALGLTCSQESWFKEWEIIQRRLAVNSFGEGIDQKSGLVTKGGMQSYPWNLTLPFVGDHKLIEAKQQYLLVCPRQLSFKPIVPI